jgi:succinate dehydrogenase / fumarate reductase cytochrome b subunit
LGENAAPRQFGLRPLRPTRVTDPIPMGTPSPIASPPGRPARPQIRNLGLSQIASYRLPAPGWVSILHRASGGLLFLLLPLLLWLFQSSLASEATFARLREAAGTIWVRVILAALAWSFAHHVFAGIRFLLLDLHIGIAKAPAQRSARVVLGLSGLAGIAAVLWLFGVI